MPKVRVVCAHDCPDMCSPVVKVEDGRAVRLQADAEEASRRRLAEGARVGFSTIVARSAWCCVSGKVPRGVVLIPGRRPDAEAVSGTVNMLCDERRTDMGEGACYQSTFLNVAARERAA